MPFYYRKTPNKNIFFTYIFYLLTDFQIFCSTFYDKFGTKYCLETILPVSEETIHDPRKFILKRQNEDNNTIMTLTI